MSLERLIAPLAHVGLFQGLELRQLREIGRMTERVVFGPGQTIVAEGAAADAALLVVRGRAAVSRGIGVPADELAAGAVIGELAMLIETSYLASVVALEPVKALRLPRAGLLAVMEADPRIAEHMAGKMAERLKALSVELKAVERGFADNRGRLRLPVPVTGPVTAPVTVPPTEPEPERSRTVEAGPLNPFDRALNIASSDDVTLSR